MNKFEKEVGRYIIANNLLKPDAKIIVGLSGGADSVALICALSRLGYHCIAAHCNFHLRGDESMRDMAHAQEIADRLHCPFRVIHFNVDEYRKKASHSPSIEMACRELRYNWFEQLRTDENAEAIAVAHSRNDNIETLLLNLFRGTGLSGLRAMLPKTERHIIRPLLCCSRSEIERYLQELNVAYIVDSTNLECDFKRNKIRNILLPQIAELFPDATQQIASTIEILQQTDSFYQESIKALRTAYTEQNGDILLSKLIKEQASHKLLLYEWLAPNGLSGQQISDIIKSAESTGRTFSADNGYYFTNRGRLCFSKNEINVPNLEELFQIEIKPIADFNPQKDSLTAYFDASKLKKSDLSVRFWQTADRIRPFGMNGTKLVSDIFNDAKIPLGLKSRIPILTIGERIIWVVGLRHTREYKITPDTTEYFEIRYIGPRFS